MDDDSLHEALIAAVKACGGSKAVAAELWPSAAARDLDGARRKLTNSLDPERAEKLSLDEVVHLMRMARQRGCHAPMEWLARTLSYAPPVPLRPRDEADQLRRQIVQVGYVLREALDRLSEIDARGAN